MIISEIQKLFHAEGECVIIVEQGITKHSMLDGVDGCNSA
jgi:hypothetical protein